MSFAGRRSLHIQKKECASCGFPAAKIRKCTCRLSLFSTPSCLQGTALTRIASTVNWSEKAKRRKTTGSGRMRYLKDVSRRFKNGFQTGEPKDSRNTKIMAKTSA